jgi:hypothetical protein
VSRYTYRRPANPLSEAIEAIIGERPPLETDGAYQFNDLSQSDQSWIQDWCSDRCNPHWGTGLGVIEAAELIVRLAVENANIPAKDAEE